jgi:hypothetical protein
LGFFVGLQDRGGCTSPFHKWNCPYVQSLINPNYDREKIIEAELGSLLGLDNLYSGCITVLSRL